MSGLVRCLDPAICGGFGGLQNPRLHFGKELPKGGVEAPGVRMKGPNVAREAAMCGLILVNASSGAPCHGSSRDRA